jgi:hypothetical protein
LRRLLSLCAISLLALAAIGAASAAAQRPLYTGLSGVYDYTPVAYQHTRATGAKFVRVGVPWGAIAPEQEPAQWNPEDPGDSHYGWGHVDAAVQYSTEAGLTPILTISGAPLWAQGCRVPAGFPESVCEPDAAALRSFAVAAARRYSGGFEGRPRVRYWQGLNEPNLSLYFLPQYDSGHLVSPDLYRKLINSFYAGIKSVNSKDLVLAAGLGPIAVPRYTVGPLKFARELLCMKGSANPKPKAGNCEGGVDFDIFDVHPYTTGGPTHKGGPNDVELGDLPRLENLLKAADRAGRIHGAYKHTPLWVTEFSWDTKPPDPHGLPMKIEARWTDEALFLASRAGVENFFWYSLRDEPLIPGQPTSTTLQSGLYFSGRSIAADRPKRIMYAFRFPFVAYPRSGGLLIWGRTPSGRRGTVKIELQGSGGWKTAARLKADKHGMFETVVHTAYGKDELGAARAVVGGVASVPFSMKPVPDFEHAPFGS